MLPGFNKRNYAILIISLAIGLPGVFLIGQPGKLQIAGFCMFLIGMVLTSINYLDINRK